MNEADIIKTIESTGEFTHLETEYSTKKPDQPMIMVFNAEKYGGKVTYVCATRNPVKWLYNMAYGMGFNNGTVSAKQRIREALGIE